MIDEEALRREMAQLCRSLFERGYAHGSAGNVSARVGEHVLVSPTNSCLGRLDPARISKVTLAGAHVGGDRPSKEASLHLGIYAVRPDVGAVVHLHSTYATVLSCLAETDAVDAMAPITPYLMMRVGRVPMVPYHPPGSGALAHAVRALLGADCALSRPGADIAAALATLPLTNVRRDVVIGLLLPLFLALPCVAWI